MSARLAIAVVLLVAAAPLHAQHADTAQFLQTLRDATARYRDRGVAIAEGYRKVGPDFPGMGEHWVQPGRLASGRFSPADPPILTYIILESGPVLTGAAFAQPLTGSEQPPEFPSRAAWHDHSASVDEESLLIAPAGHSRRHADTAPRARLAMLHAWIWVENPDGVFAQENWALPYIRAGLDPPDQVSVDAARALSFAATGRDYFLALVDAAAAPDAYERGRIDELASALAEEVSRIIGAADKHREGALAAAWRSLWQEIERGVSVRTWRSLQPFAPGHH